MMFFLNSDLLLFNSTISTHTKNLQFVLTSFETNNYVLQSYVTLSIHGGKKGRPL